MLLQQLHLDPVPTELKEVKTEVDWFAEHASTDADRTNTNNSLTQVGDHFIKTLLCFFIKLISSETYINCNLHTHV